MSDTASSDLVLLCDDFSYAYGKVFDAVMTRIEERVNKLGLPQSAKEQFVAKGFDVVSDLALRLAITKTSNKDNLALKALEAIANMIGMMAQGGMEINKTQFEIFYKALKEIMQRAGVEIPEYTEPTTEDTEQQ